VSNDILTTAFLDNRVKDVGVRELLSDLRRPRTRLFGAVGAKYRIHIFDQTNKIWIACTPLKTKTS